MSKILRLSMAYNQGNNDGKLNRASKVPTEIRKFKEVLIKDVSNTRHSLNGLINQVTHKIDSRSDLTTDHKKSFSEQANTTKSEISHIEKELLKKAQPLSDFDQLLNLHDLFERDVKMQSTRFSNLVARIDSVLAKTIDEQTMNTLNHSKYNLESLLYQLEEFQLQKQAFTKSLAKDREIENFTERNK
jgi:hypothetical protein